MKPKITQDYDGDYFLELSAFSYILILILSLVFFIVVGVITYDNADDIPQQKIVEDDSY